MYFYARLSPTATSKKRCAASCNRQLSSARSKQVGSTGVPLEVRTYCAVRSAASPTRCTPLRVVIVRCSFVGLLRNWHTLPAPLVIKACVFFSIARLFTFSTAKSVDAYELFLEFRSLLHELLLRFGGLLLLLLELQHHKQVSRLVPELGAGSERGSC